MIADARPPHDHKELHRSCRLDNGKPKMAFASRKGARGYARDALGIGTLRPYSCRHCGSWHLASVR